MTRHEDSVGARHIDNIGLERRRAGSMYVACCTPSHHGIREFIRAGSFIRDPWAIRTRSVSYPCEIRELSVRDPRAIRTKPVSYSYKICMWSFQTPVRNYSFWILSCCTGLSTYKTDAVEDPSSARSHRQSLHGTSVRLGFVGLSEHVGARLARLYVISSESVPPREGRWLAVPGKSTAQVVL